MKLVSCNCRGLGGKPKLKEVKRLMHSESMSILTIHETKMEIEYCIAVMEKIWKSGQGSAVSSQGALRGIVTWWDATIFELISKVENRHWLFV